MSKYTNIYGGSGGEVYTNTFTYVCNIIVWHSIFVRSSSDIYIGREWYNRSFLRQVSSILKYNAIEAYCIHRLIIDFNIMS